MKPDLNRYRNPRFQLIAVIVLVNVALGIAWYRMSYSAHRDLIASITRRDAVLAETNQLARTAISEQGIDKVRDVVRAYQREQEAIEHLLPAYERSTSLQSQISALAQQSGVMLVELQPSLAPELAGDYTIVKYRVGIHGHYHEIGAFLAAAGSMTPVVHVNELAMKVIDHGAAAFDVTDDRRPMEATMEMRIHYLADETIRKEQELQEQSQAKQSTPTVSYELEPSGLIWTILTVGERRVRIPTPEQGLDAARAWLSANGDDQGGDG